MKKLAIAALAATAFAAPAFADGHAAAFAVMHFNSSQDDPQNRRMVPMGDGPMVVDLAPGSTLAEVLGHFNMNTDSVSDMRGNMGVTVITEDQTIARRIFEILAEEQMDMGN